MPKSDAFASQSLALALNGDAYPWAASGAGTAIASIAGAAVITVSATADPLTTVWMIAEPITSELTADAIAAAVMASGIEAGMTMTQALRLVTAALAGKADVSGSTVTFRDVNDTKNRITATVSGDGDRTAVTLDAD